MRKLSVVFGIVLLCALPALAQAQAQTQSAPSPTFKERTTNPLRNTPAGREPQQDPTYAITLGSTQTQECRKQFDEASTTVASWSPSARKTNALKELEGANVALRGDDARTCRAHIQAALRPE